MDCIRSSRYKNDMKYCFILFHREINSGNVSTWVDCFKDSNYVKVCNGRPLVYFFNMNTFTDAEINLLCTASINAGAGDPYVVGMAEQNNDRGLLDAGSYYKPFGLIN